MGILINMLFRSGENIKFCFKLQRRTIKSVFGLGIASSIFLAGSSFKREQKERKIDFSFADQNSLGTRASLNSLRTDLIRAT